MRILLLTVISVLVIVVLAVLLPRSHPAPTANLRSGNSNITAPSPTSLVSIQTEPPTTLPTPSVASGSSAIVPPQVTTTPTPSLVVPIADFFTRVTKKPFGIYITPRTSPIQPEKFTGYHTGADAETTAAEKNVDVPIVAIAKGTVVFAGHVNGYGGVIIIRHVVGGKTVSALYGHLRIASFTVKTGATVTAGQKIAVLGTGYSSETDGERKHLHFGIVKGATINYKGYVTTKSALAAWEDPVAWLHRNGL